MTTDTQIIIFGVVGGLIPAFFWLWFWLREDRRRPEPRGLIFLSFVVGMIAVPIAIPIQRMVTTDFSNITVLTILLWATIEEILKYLGSYTVALRKRTTDEPIDPMIYLITTALGFAALENSLFLINSISSNGFLDSIITGNMRFIGATLLHTVSSASIGLFMAFAFYKSRFVKRLSLIIGVITAISLHTLFNFFIISTSDSGIFWVFAIVWMLVVVLILFFERVKKIKRN